MKTNGENRSESCGTRQVMGFPVVRLSLSTSAGFYFWNRFPNLFKFLCILGSLVQNPMLAPPFTEGCIYVSPFAKRTNFPPVSSLGRGSADCFSNMSSIHLVLRILPGSQIASSQVRVMRNKWISHLSCYLYAR